MMGRVVLFVITCLFSAAAFAEEAGSQPPGERAIVSLQAGFASGSSHMAGAALGGTVVYDLGARVALEGAGSYLSRAMGASGLSLSANLLVHLRPRTDKAVPYLAVGGGLYRASFDMGRSRFSGPARSNVGPGMMSGDGMDRGYGPGPGGSFGEMPMFYANRMGVRAQDQRLGHDRFTDPAVSLGGGIRIDLGSRLSLRPDARALVVTSSGESYTVGVFTINLGYRF